MKSIAAGTGHIVLDTHGSDAIFTQLSYAYPLKLLSPRSYQPRVAVVYVLSYGGGLVGGDQIDLSVVVGKDSTLVMLSQGFTKVFKVRPGRQLVAREDRPFGGDITSQRLNITIPANGALFVLPDLVACFRSAKYHQLQTFHLSAASSLVLLDWFNSGRKSIGEEWAFDKYYSLNEVFVDGHRVARDVTLLENSSPQKEVAAHSLAAKMAPYSCYALLLLYGPLTQTVRDQLAAAYQTITVFKQAALPEILWSFSSLREDKGAVIRVAAKETEHVRNWLRVALQGFESVIGVDIYKKALG